MVRRSRTHRIPRGISFGGSLVPRPCCRTQALQHLEWAQDGRNAMESLASEVSIRLGLISRVVGVSAVVVLVFTGCGLAESATDSATGSGTSGSDASDSTADAAGGGADAVIGWEIGNQVATECAVAWPSAPTRTSDVILMRTTCKGQPSGFLFVDIQYPDPDLPVDPSTGFFSVQGTVVDHAQNEMGFQTIQVLADSVVLP